MKIVAFDLDGTLVDSVGDIATALNMAFADVDLAPVPVEVVRTYVGNGARMLVTRALAAAVSSSGGSTESATPPGTSAMLARFRGHYDKGLIDQTVAFPGLLALLDELKPRARIAVATNKPGEPARMIVQALFPGRADLVLGPDDVGVLKPAPDMLRAVARSLEGELAVFVGDSGVDEEPAKNAGVPFIGVSWGLRPEELTGAVAHDARELALMIDRYLQ